MTCGFDLQPNGPEDVNPDRPPLLKHQTHVAIHIQTGETVNGSFIGANRAGVTIKDQDGFSFIPWPALVMIGWLPDQEPQTPREPEQQCL